MREKRARFVRMWMRTEERRSLHQIYIVQKRQRLFVGDKLPGFEYATAIRRFFQHVQIMRRCNDGFCAGFPGGQKSDNLSGAAWI